MLVLIHARNVLSFAMWTRRLRILDEHVSSVILDIAQCFQTVKGSLQHFLTYEIVYLYGLTNDKDVLLKSL